METTYIKLLIRLGGKSSGHVGEAGHPNRAQRLKVSSLFNRRLPMAIISLPVLFNAIQRMNIMLKHCNHRHCKHLGVATPG